jgi:hypothetical protein
MFLFPFETFGGNGFNTEYPVEKLFCNAKSLFEETDVMGQCLPHVTVMFIHISCCVLYEQREAWLAWRRRKVRLKLLLTQGQSFVSCAVHRAGKFSRTYRGFGVGNQVQVFICFSKVNLFKTTL